MKEPHQVMRSIVRQFAKLFDSLYQVCMRYDRLLRRRLVGDSYGGTKAKLYRKIEKPSAFAIYLLEQLGVTEGAKNRSKVPGHLLLKILLRSWKSMPCEEKRTYKRRYSQRKTREGLKDMCEKVIDELENVTSARSPRPSTPLSKFSFKCLQGFKARPRKKGSFDF